jgi:hypothetical protein
LVGWFDKRNFEIRIEEEEEEEHDDPSKVIFSEEIAFQIPGTVNRYNYRI